MSYNIIVIKINDKQVKGGKVMAIILGVPDKRTSNGYNTEV